ncbi:MAG: PhnD/SsuA/transferrin family substrate-binding protein [Candidatus Izemoplasmatales bacterium]|nr:PhnD/SsuA/transferrin family substrate-binding protein [Candidatus Izemoplasmatales bacterium]
MKKILGLLLVLLFSFGLASCTQAAVEDPETLIIQFVPSTSVDSAMLTKVLSLETMLEAELLEAGYDINVSISIGTSYASVIEAMASGQVHVAFLTAQQYAFVTTEYPGKVDVLLTSVRNAYKAQVDAQGNEIIDPAVIIANANASGYDGTSNSDVKVSSYYSMLLVRTEDYQTYLTGGLAALAGKNVGTQSVTSGSGYVYPSFLLSQNNLSFVTGTPNAANGEVQATTISGHQNAVNALLNDEVDAVFTFFDARYHATAYAAWQEANPTLNIFEETRVVALTTGIYNDTISGLSSLSDGLRAAIQQAFISVIATEDGLAALSIYNHTGYSIAVDSDYDGERALYTFLHPGE